MKQFVRCLFVIDYHNLSFVSPVTLYGNANMLTYEFTYIWATTMRLA